MIKGLLVTRLWGFYAFSNESIVSVEEVKGKKQDRGGGPEDDGGGSEIKAEE